MADDPVTAQHRAHALRICRHLNACADAHARLEHSGSSDRTTEPPGTEDTVTLTDEHGTERTFTSTAAVRSYVADERVASTGLRRAGWTVPEHGSRKIDADSACLLLTTDNPVVRIDAELGMDGTLHNPVVVHGDAEGGLAALDLDATGVDRRGVRFATALHRFD